MISKMLDWMFGRLSEKCQPANKPSSENWKNVATIHEEAKNKVEENANGQVHEERQFHDAELAVVSAKNSPVTIPKALKSAFDQPEETKKPFSYFGRGQTPDLSHKPSPRAVRRAANSSAFKALGVPRVLPIVPDQEERRYSAAFLVDHNRRENVDGIYRPSDFTKSLTNSSQYNTPVALYSKQTFNEEMKAQQNHITNGDISFKVISNHSTNGHDYENTENFHKYTGMHANPKSQSPCFKRLQYVTGLHTDSEDEPAVEVRPTDVRTMENGHQKPAAQQETIPTVKPRMYTSYHHVEPPRTTPLLQPPTYVTEPQRRRSPEPQQTMREPQKRYHEHPCDTAVEDSALLVKIMEAERPKIPNKVVPEWTRQAAAKHEKWRGYAEYQDDNRYEGPTIPTSRLTSPAPWQSRKSPSPYSGGSFTLPRSTQESREALLKPFVSSNVIESKFTTPLTVRTSLPTPTYKVYSPTESSRGQSQIYDSSSNTNLHYQNTPANYSFSSVRTQEQSSIKEPTATPRYKIETTYYTPITPKPESSSISRQSPAPWTAGGGSSALIYRPPTVAGARKSGHRLFEHEHEAFEKKKELEREMAKKTSAATQKCAPSPGWRPVAQDRNVTAPAGDEPVAITQRWQDATGANTKSQTSGSYVDSDGNLVHYVKEVYTSSDPGQEFSMLSQQEQKVLEETLEPGVIARHTTTKYYKKATFTSATTTSASQSTPAISGAPTASATLPRSRPPYKAPVIETAY